MSGLSAARASAACGGRLRVGVRSEDRTKTRIINPPGRSTYLSEKAVRTSETTVGDGDFEDAISYVKSELHKEVWVSGSQANLSADLQSYADNVLWLEDMSAVIDK